MTFYGLSTSNNSVCFDTNDENLLTIDLTKRNIDIIKHEISKGFGENLEAIFISKGCDRSEYLYFSRLLKSKYSDIYNKSTYNVYRVEELINEINRVIVSDPWLNASCERYSPSRIIALN